MMMRVMMLIFDDDDESDVYNDDESDIYIMMTRVIYDDDDEYVDDLCACIRVVHFSESLALICELFEYVYTCVTCRIYFYAFI
jgi:hypothetical protein